MRRPSTSTMSMEFPFAVDEKAQTTVTDTVSRRKTCHHVPLDDFYPSGKRWLGTSWPAALTARLIASRAKFTASLSDKVRLERRRTTTRIHRVPFEGCRWRRP